MSRRSKIWLGVLCGLVPVMLVLARMASGRPKRAALPDLVEEASLESFPASDPPAWTTAVLPRV